MLRKILIFTAIFVLANAIETKAENPFQSWLTLEASQRLDYGLEAAVSVENRLTEKDPTWQQIQLEPMMIWHYSPRYDFSLGYMWTNTQMDDGTAMIGHESVASGTVKLPLKEWMISSRQRFQFGTMEDETTGVFRQLTRVEYDASWMPFRLKPFIADEWFYDLMNGFVPENRLYGGLSYKWNRMMMTEVYCMKQDLWDADDMNANGLVFGLTAKMSF